MLLSTEGQVVAEGTSVSWLWHTAAGARGKEALRWCGPEVGK